MKVCDLQFDEDLETSIFLDALKEESALSFVWRFGSIRARTHRRIQKKIVQFLEEISIWYDKTTVAVKQYADNKYSIKDISDSDIELMAIFIRFEQDEPALLD